MKTLTQKVFDNILCGHSATDLIDVITVTNLESMLEILEEDLKDEDYDIGVDAEEVALDISALRRVITLFSVRGYKEYA